jgi:hypothetical protein
MLGRESVTAFEVVPEVVDSLPAIVIRSAYCESALYLAG